MTSMRRRDFLRRSLCATAASAAFGSMLGKLSLANAAIPRTRTLLDETTGESREDEIARMLGGKTDSALAHARVLLGTKDPGLSR